MDRQSQSSATDRVRVTDAPSATQQESDVFLKSLSLARVAIKKKFLDGVGSDGYGA